MAAHTLTEGHEQCATDAEGGVLTVTLETIGVHLRYDPPGDDRTTITGTRGIKTVLIPSELVPWLRRALGRIDG